MLTRICCFPKTEKAQQNEVGLKKQLEEALKEVRGKNCTSSIFYEYKCKYYIMFPLIQQHRKVIEELKHAREGFKEALQAKDKELEVTKVIMGS